MIDILGVVKTTGIKMVTKVKKVSPQILLIGGSAAIITGIVIACKKTKDAGEVIKEHEEIRDTIDKVEIGTTYESDGKELTYSSKDRNEDLTKLYFKTVKDLIKVYALPAGVIIGGFGMIFSGFGILHKRNTQAIAAATAISKAFEDYKDKVKEKLGKEAEKDIRFNAQEFEKETVEETKDGKKKAKKTKWKSYSDLVNDPYARCFDEMNPYYKRDNQENKNFLLRSQSWANDLLRAQGHCFLNEVYDILGFERTAAGAVTGWVLGNGGDDFIDFGIDDGILEANRAFNRGEEPAIWLDFNVDGVILDYI